AGLGRMLRMRHQADDVAAGVRDSRDIVHRAVRVHADVAEHDLALTLETRELLGRGDEAALAVLERNDDLGAGLELVGPGGRRVLDAQHLVTADESAVIVAHEAAGQKVRLGEHLEAVADTEHGHAGVRGVDDLAHDRRVCCDRAAAEIVAVAETPRQHDGVDATEVVVAVPERDRLRAREAHGALRVSVVERAGEGDDADAHQATTARSTGAPSTEIATTSSITEL